MDEPGDTGQGGGPGLEHVSPHGGTLPPHVLTIRPFLWLVVAQTVASFAFWAYFGTVFADAAYRFHATSSQMALLGAAISVPFALSIPIQGVLVDRWSPKWLNACGCIAMLAGVPLAWQATSIVWLYGCAFLVGAGFSAIEPSRSALTGLLVEPAQLVQANGMLSAAFQMALVLGTLAGGFVLERSGSGTVYLASFIIGAFSLLFILTLPDVRQTGRRPTLSLHDLGEGFRTSWRLPELRLMLFVTMLGWAMANVFFVLEPLFIKSTLHRGGGAVLYLWSVHGAGAMLGAIAVSRARKGSGRELALVGSGVVAVGTGLLVYVGVGTYPVAFVGAVVMGAGMSFFFAPALALIQRVAGEEQRGRVTSVFGALQESTGLAGSLAIAVLALSIAAIRPVLIGAGVILVLTGAAGLRAFSRLRGHVDVAR